MAERIKQRSALASVERYSRSVCAAVIVLLSIACWALIYALWTLAAVEY